MIERLLDKYLPRKDIYLEGVLYLKRWWLGEFLGRTYLLHKFCSEDQDRYLHTHPWACWSLILWGSYHEEYATAICAIRGPVLKSRIKRFFNWIPGDRLHRVVKLNSKTCWTLFSVGPKQAKWGYLERLPVIVDYPKPKGVVGKLMKPRWQYVPYDEKLLAEETKVVLFGTCKWWSGTNE